MSDFAEFKQCYSLADKLIDELTKEQVAESARMMAVHLADYVQRFGEIPQGDLLSRLGTAKISAREALLLRDGMLMLAGYLAAVRNDPDDDGIDLVH